MPEPLSHAWAKQGGRPGPGTESGIGSRIVSQVRSNAHMWSRVTLPKNASVYNCGTPDRALYVVESGLVKTMTVARSGKECLLDIYAPGDVLGEASLLGGTRMESAAAMSRSALMRIPADNFLEVLDAEGLTGSFLCCVINRVIEHQQAITRFVTVNSEVRLAMTLLRLGRKLGQPSQHKNRGGLFNIHEAGTWLCVSVKITHEELAEMVGTTRTRIGIFLKKFREVGLIHGDASAFLTVNETRMLAYLNEAES